ncbi:isoaspartyl peptidase/L-asparaginase [Flaviaesturariibacter flavus]|uniref:Isoaspartyl peptidase n=1 Tax=Flaviaesturariibacter flavus TaxID=2502780 RepID=A0A4R1B6T1_9BACT|nr:isoaspartyl peptidase/L-asparaginase [Flaviaesturariibacter flavus]TCJ12038.1 isoaspartyl peptidase/L-asparaginase [Flaviaesturariibacter flavus]
MRLLLTISTVLLSLLATAQQQRPDFMLVIHGGAGTILKKNMTPELERQYQQGLERALQAGYAILNRGGTALDAVEATVRVLEDDSLFNAGRGAVFTNEGRNELDAAIMDGRTLKAGAVASVTTVRNPVTAARAVMDKTEHVMLIGPGAEKFAREQGLVIVDPSYFRTERAWRALQRAKTLDSLKAVQQAGGATPKQEAFLRQPGNHDYKYGTVGAVALDKAGNLAAATSTGGMTNKKYGRVGDAPIIGAGTFASNATCAVSCTGWGEYFIRLSVARSVSDLMEYKGMSVQAAADEMIQKKVPALGGDGGLIALDRNGNFTFSFNTEGMYRGYIRPDGKPVVKIYKEQ